MISIKRSTEKQTYREVSGLKKRLYVQPSKNQVVDQKRAYERTDKRLIFLEVGASNILKKHDKPYNSIVHKTFFGVLYLALSFCQIVSSKL